ncbi:hypothetical protein ISN45_Aa02g016600 [Arabidopsis thaliana x Arabidopsis arenosa]|uniref:Uncharacterized protein n=1 Tax=Arabidopsis thaliana x Arabidopsis arenosa TaxID=1240361 RepID=A0A8T2BRV8_9BRAS|nr:hypothetical protein ISN45_Aa02g016600 [Arabidopsis thaliana x Arabidopsis arenosa]
MRIVFGSYGVVVALLGSAGLGSGLQTGTRVSTPEFEQVHWLLQERVCTLNNEEKHNYTRGRSYMVLTVLKGGEEYYKQNHVKVLKAAGVFVYRQSYGVLATLGPHLWNNLIGIHVSRLC